MTNVRGNWLLSFVATTLSVAPRRDYSPSDSFQASTAPAQRVSRNDAHRPNQRSQRRSDHEDPSVGLRVVQWVATADENLDIGIFKKRSQVQGSSLFLRIWNGGKRLSASAGFQKQPKNPRSDV